MIARLQILLPYSFSVPGDQELVPYEIEVDGYAARVYPPHKSQLDHSILEPDSPRAMTDLGQQLQPAEPQPRTDLIRVEGHETTQADVLRIDFVRTDFDRRPGADDPPTEMGFRLANDLLARLRTLGRSGHVKPVSPDSTIWGIEYFNDDGSKPEPDQSLVRGRFGVAWRWDVFGLRQSVWGAARDLPKDFAPTAWDTLLLDALNLLPEVGPAVVLAFAAIETRVESALDLLASEAELSDELWSWIKERENDYRKEPSIAEQLDPLLHALSGHSLKDENRLWEAFQNLRKARNTFVHEGLPMIGGQPVTYERASQLVALTGDIIDWIEQLLPEEKRRPRYEAEHERAVELTKILVAPAAERTPSEEGRLHEKPREEQ